MPLRRGRPQHQPWALCRVSDGRGRHSENSLRRHLAAHCGIAAAARHFDRVRRSIVMRWLKLTGEACLDERKFDMSRLWTGRWPGRTPINNAYWRFRLVWQAKPSQYEPETGGHLGDVRLEAFRICGGMIVNEKVVVVGGTWWQEQFAKARHVRFAEDISIINVAIDPEACISIEYSLYVIRR